MSAIKTKVCLVVIDGWGLAAACPTNAVTEASTPCMTGLTHEHLAASLDAAGISVGLPAGVMGNSEVGHLTIGAGRVNFQDLERINFSIDDGSFFTNPNLIALFENAKATTGRLHMAGLLSDGGVHSHINHVKAFLRAARDNGVPECYLHAFTDGRDTAPRSALGYVKEIVSYMSEIGYGRVASVVGRYFAMDRDKRWERVEVAYNALIESKGATIVEGNDGLFAAIEAKYAADETDEFFKPIVVTYGQPKPAATGADVTASNILDHDSLLMFDFRADRMREIALTLGQDQRPFEVPVDDEGNTLTISRTGVYAVQMTRYDSKYTMPVLYPPNDMRDGLCEWISKKGLTQFHTAETEKYAHVTFFFNGGIEAPFEREDRDMVQSPKVATYDLMPVMNAAGVAKSVTTALDTNKYDLVMCNFAPPDMVGHTGVLPAAIKAVEATDAAIAEIMESCIKNNYTLAITADHGNAEQMLNIETGVAHTAHTSNPVPFLVRLSGDYPNKDTIHMKNVGGVSDVAPTVLSLMGLDIPKVMTGKSLIF